MELLDIIYCNCSVTWGQLIYGGGGNGVWRRNWVHLTGLIMSCTLHLTDNTLWAAPLRVCHYICVAKSTKKESQREMIPMKLLNSLICQTNYENDLLTYKLTVCFLFHPYEMCLMLSMGWCPECMAWDYSLKFLIFYELFQSHVTNIYKHITKIYRLLIIFWFACYELF